MLVSTAKISGEASRKSHAGWGLLGIEALPLLNSCSTGQFNQTYCLHIHTCWHHSWIPTFVIKCHLLGFDAEVTNVLTAFIVRNTEEASILHIQDEFPVSGFQLLASFTLQRRRKELNLGLSEGS